MKKVIQSLAIMLILTSVVLSQTVTLTTYGVSPFDVAKDSIQQYFNRPYNGLENVGKETKVFLKGNSTLTLQSPTWAFLQKPAGSNAVFGTVKNVDTSNQIITFTPDIKGTYKITFFSGTKGDTIVINAALYLGVEGGLVTCKTCHNSGSNNYFDKWAGTQHAITSQKGFDGMLSSHFNATCLECHTTGFDANSANDGFDDFPFVFPGTLAPGTYAQLLTQYPDAMKRANVQCESCHGPGGEHYSQVNDSKISTTLSAANCTVCHEDGYHNIKPVQWDVSKHANGSNFFSGSSRWSCTPCHNGQGFIDKIKGRTQSVTEVIKITCATCHDPHDASQPHQLRNVTVNLMNGVAFDGGTGALCVNCHQGRRVATTYVEGFLSSLSSHFGPHYSQQGDMIAGTNAYTWGQTLPSSPHLAATTNACVDCHMAEGDHPLGSIPLSGGHSFSMSTPDGIDNVATCEPCHGNVGSDFDEKKYYINGNADLDRNGVAEGLQHEIHGLLDQVALLLPPYGSTSIAVIDSSWTLNEAAGMFNYKFVYYDRSYGVHNPQFTVALLYQTIGQLGGTVSIDDLDFNTPSDYVLKQNYPNPFNPSTTIDFSVPFDSKVRISIYNINGEVISELFNGSKSAGNHKVDFNTTGLNLASGIYFYSIEASASNGEKSFRETKKMVLLK